MTNKEQVQRILALHYLLSNRKFPKMKDFQNYYNSKGWKSSERTINRDLDFLKTDLELKISYNRTYNGYKLEVEQTSKIEQLLTLLQANHSYTYFLREEVFSTSRRWLFNHQTYLIKLLEAIEFKQKIEISYKTYDRDYTKTYILHPYHIREAGGRLYLTAQPDDENKVIATYALERITELKVLQDQYQLKKPFDAFKHFEFCLGSWRENESGKLIPPKNIILELDKEAFNYIKDYPIHFSQEVIRVLDNGRRFQFRIYVQDNHDLYNTLLQIRRTLKVISPPEVKNQFRNILKEALLLNKD